MNANDGFTSDDALPKNDSAKPLPNSATMNIWPEAGQMLGYTNRSSAYRAAKAGYIPTVRLSERRWVVPLSMVKQKLGIDNDPSNKLDESDKK